jgi:hypothetical protein
VRLEGGSVRALAAENVVRRCRGLQERTGVGLRSAAGAASLRIAIAVAS